VLGAVQVNETVRNKGSRRMRIAAGVLLIIVSVINLVVGLGYLVGGAAVGGGSKLAASMTEMAEKSNPNMTAEQRAELAKSKAQLTQLSAEAGSKAGMLVGFGAFLLIVTGVAIAGAVQLFRSKGATFIMVVAVLVLAAEIIGAVILKFGVMNVPGVVAAVLSLLAARGIAAKGAAAGAPAAPAPM
jgi:hypothetical protein